jgi:hypothetical protein
MFALPLTNSTIAESKILNVNFPSNVHGITIAVQLDSRTPPASGTNVSEGPNLHDNRQIFLAGF